MYIFPSHRFDICATCSGEEWATDLCLEDKVAIVTGGSYGLGKSICLGLAAEGAKVVVNYRKSPERAEAVVKEIQDTYGVEAPAVYADMGNEAEIMRMFAEIDAKFVQLDILVNNAAICPQSWMKDTSENMWNAVLQVNLTGTFIACREKESGLVTPPHWGRGAGDVTSRIILNNNVNLCKLFLKRF
jgi:NAD(P)-dependent dehydrogenase (short-subunit alcohol dehydrogenase family)